LVSLNTPVATVSNGYITGVSPGQATITATVTLPVAGEYSGYNPSCYTLQPSYPFTGQGTANVTPTVTIQVQSGLVSMAGNGLVVLAGPGGLGTTAITGVGNPSGGAYTWTAGPNLSIGGVNSANASVGGTAASTSAGDTYISLAYTVNGQTGNASFRFTVLNPVTMQAASGTFPGGAKDTTVYKNGEYVGYILEMDYYLYDQITSAIIALPGLTFTETLQTTSNPDYAQFIPPDNTPTTAHSDATGKMIDLLYASYPFGLPPGFTAIHARLIKGT
jgi:hypothetical protein